MGLWVPFAPFLLGIFFFSFFFFSIGLVFNYLINRFKLRPIKLFKKNKQTKKHVSLNSYGAQKKSFYEKSKFFQFPNSKSWSPRGQP